MPGNQYLLDCGSIKRIRKFGFLLALFFQPKSYRPWKWLGCWFPLRLSLGCVGEEGDNGLEHPFLFPEPKN